MYLIYGIITNFVFLISPLIIFIRLIKGKEDPERFKEKFCVYSEKNNLKTIWFHAASVGELMSIIPILKEYDNNKKIKKIILTTSTTSSAKIFKKLKFKKITHKFFPIDTNFLSNKFINFWQPKVAIFVESEIWPNMYKNLDKNKIPIIILNARITKKSFKKWKIFKQFSKKIFDKINLALPQNLESKKYLKILGVKNIKNAGNLKYFGKIKKSKKSDLLIKKKFKNFKVWCATSTHSGEEILISKIHKKIKNLEKKLITIIIPRHVNRSKNIVNELERMNLKVITHSSGKKIKYNSDIYLVDVYGETSKFFNLSKITFVGGSIINHGGQNPLEPARLGNYIINGPNIDNFSEIYAFLVKNKISQTSSSIKIIEKNVVEKLNRNISKKKIDKIIKIGDKVFENNISYISKYTT